MPEDLTARVIRILEQTQRLEPGRATAESTFEELGIDSLDGINMDVYGTMWGPNEFTCIGNLRNWDRLADLHRVRQRVLVVCGMHDELTPDSAARVARALPDARLEVFKNSAHMPFFEEPSAYFATLQAFLDDHRG